MLLTNATGSSAHRYGDSETLFVKKLYSIVEEKASQWSVERLFKHVIAVSSETN